MFPSLRSDGPQGEALRQCSLFEESDVTGMIHRGDPDTSTEAAIGLLPRLGALHERVAAALESEGPMDDERLEQLPQFQRYGPSTIRKRRSELYQAGKVERRSVHRNSRGQRMIVWGLCDGARERQT